MTPVPEPLASAVREWLARRYPVEAAFGGAAMIEDALRRHPQDPAYVQSLRLLAKERQYHAGLLARLREAMGLTPPPPPRPLVGNAASLPGARFELSLILLSDFIEIALLRMLRHAAPATLPAAVCEALLRDRTAHAAFAAERLTMELAELNFVRRNLRRARLRAMFGVALSAAALRHARLLHATGSSPAAFAWQRCHAFRALLERVVPYRRDALLAALLDQREHPYDEPGPV